MRYFIQPRAYSASFSERAARVLEGAATDAERYAPEWGGAIACAMRAEAKALRTAAASVRRLGADRDRALACVEARSWETATKAVAELIGDGEAEYYERRDETEIRARRALTMGEY